MAMKSALHIKTGLRRGKTILPHSFCTQPFKIADVTEDPSQKALWLMLMSSSPGILNGDTYHLQIEVAEGCSLHLQTQSYQRLHQMKDGAMQVMEVHMEMGSSFSFLPHPTVPHEGSKFVSRSKLYLAKGCTLTWGEVLSCGRKLNGEVFRFSSYHSITEIFIAGRLVVKENLLVKPEETNMQGIGQLEGWSHQATLIYIAENVTAHRLIEAMTELLQAQTEVVFGITALPVSGMLLRLLGNKAEVLFRIIKLMADFIDGFSKSQTINSTANVIRT